MRLPIPDTLRRAAFVLASTQIVPNRHRLRVLRRLGLGHVDDVLIGPGVIFTRPGSVSAGSGTFINAGVFFDAGPTTLGRNVYIGPRVVLVTGRHSMGPAQFRAGQGRHTAIDIGDGCWIGAGAVILPGVSIGTGCVIGAGAVVTRDCDPDGLYVGVPARRIRDLPPDGEAIPSEGEEHGHG